MRSLALVRDEDLARLLPVQSRSDFALDFDKHADIYSQPNVLV